MPGKNRKEFQKLVDKYLNGTATPDEQAALDQYYLLFRDEPENSQSFDKADLQALEARMENNLFQRIHRPAKVKRLWPRIAAAASILLILSSGAYFVLHRTQKPTLTAHNQVHDIAPGSNKATLTLANGKQIVLTGTKTGLLATQGKTAINVNSGNDIVYDAQATAASEALQYNTMTTPKGGQHSLTLADGTKVWLDAASSITFPVAFTKNERAVNITGQVYFEVTHDAKKPFKVTANGQTVEVLGTHFNINAYTDEPATKTTLFEGSVKISAADQQAILKPGQQARLAHNQITIEKNADTEEAIAWHKGMFQFKSADMKTVLRQLSRWYDVEFVYQTNIADRHFSGGIFRTDALKISDILTYEKINFRMEGRQIIITP